MGFSGKIYHRFSKVGLVRGIAGCKSHLVLSWQCMHGKLKVEVMA